MQGDSCLFDNAGYELVVVLFPWLETDTRCILGNEELMALLLVAIN
jgi:hypothetical protein